jgi:acyl carrier protein
MRDSFHDLVCAAIARHLDVDPRAIEAAHRLDRDLALSSLDLVLIALRLEEREQIEFPVGALASVATVGELTSLVRSWVQASEIGAPLALVDAPRPSRAEARLQHARRSARAHRRNMGHRAQRRAAHAEARA